MTVKASTVVACVEAVPTVEVERLNTVQDWITVRRRIWHQRLDRLGEVLAAEAAVPNHRPAYAPWSASWRASTPRRRPAWPTISAR